MTRQEFRNAVLEQLQQDTMENVIQEVKIVCIKFGDSPECTSLLPLQKIHERIISIRALLNQAAIESRGI